MLFVIGSRGPRRGRDAAQLIPSRFSPSPNLTRASREATSAPRSAPPSPLRSAWMGKKLYVGNLAYGVTDSELQQMCEAFGTVTSAQVIMDRDTGRSKGFGFVEMGSDQEAQAAIEALNGQQIDGRALTVNEARPKTEGGGGRGGYGDGRGYGGGGRGNY